MELNNLSVLTWLLEGDVSIQYQTQGFAEFSGEVLLSVNAAGRDKIVENLCLRCRNIYLNPILPS